MNEAYLLKEPSNAMTLSNNVLYTLNKLNRCSFSKKNSEGFSGLKTGASARLKLKIKLAQIFALKTPEAFFDLTQIKGYEKLYSDFKRSNTILAELDLIPTSILEKYNYPC